ncbi:MAG: DNA-3-methyladenine glycosylase [Chloroflexi bacterium OHK40]|jgi:DNA-3-methyladenine glycosylase II
MHLDYTLATEHLCAADPVLGALIARIGPVELQPTGHSFATLASAIVSQQISVQAAAAIMRRLEATAGTITPEAILATSPENLRAAGLSTAKAGYLLDLAARAVAGAFDTLPTLSDEAAIARLTAVKGIGLWTAEIYLLFALGRPDILPAGDLGLRYAIHRFYERPAPPTPAEVRALGEPWRPYRSIAAWYLWRARRHL